MSSSPRQQSSWLLQVYDKIVLVVVLFIMLASALFLVMQIRQGRQSLREASWENPGIEKKVVQEVNLQTYEATLLAMQHPFQATQRASRTMVSELRVTCVSCGKPISYSAVKCPFCGAEQPKVLDPTKVDSDGDGIPDVYERSKGFNPSSAEDALQDSDQDGFSNLEEYLENTDPTNLKDSPPPPAKLRLIRVVSNPFKLRFQGVQKLADGNRYQLNLRSLERTFFVRLGDDIDGFRVLEYLPTAPEGETLVLGQGAVTIRLVKGKAITQNELVADMILLIDKSRLRQKVGDVFKIKEQDYKVIDIGRNRVLIRNVETGKDTSVGMLSSQEIEMLRAASSESTQMGGAASGGIRPDARNNAVPQSTISAWQ
ncbi:MAG: Amuc_1099 family pilus-like system protein [Lentisphaerota bacterium]